MKKIISLLPVLCISAAILSAQAKSDSRYEPAIIILRNLSIENGKIRFTSDTGGCTDKSSFRISFNKDNPGKVRPSHYDLTIERIKPDYCKAFLPDGVSIELDLEKDCGLKGNYTVTVLNPVTPK